MTEEPKTNEEQPTKEVGVPMASINGVVLTLIGILLLMTPFTIKDMDQQKAVIDYIAGGVLTTAGIISFICGQLKK